MVKGSFILASLLALGLLSTAPRAHAEESLNDAIAREMPILKDGTRLPLADIERAILTACERNKFRATVVAPGVIEARRRWRKSIVLTIPYSDEGFAVQSSRQDVAELVDIIQADLARELVRYKSLQKPMRRDARINPRRAV